MHFFSDSMNAGTYVDVYAPEKPFKPLIQLVNEASLFLVNQNIYCLDYPKVTAPNYHFLTGMTKKDPKPLPKDFSDFVDSDEKGFIYMSFGSTQFGKVVMGHFLHTALKVFSDLGVKVILQFNTEKTYSFPSNVKWVKWSPQNDILGHPQLLAFITHGGGNGQVEAAYHGAPMLTISISDETAYNGHRVERHGMGKHLIFNDVTEEVFREAVLEMVNNNTYREASHRCSEITKSLPSGAETMQFWINHILKFGGEHLRPASADLSIYSLYMLDIFVALAIAVLVALIIVIIVIKIVIRIIKSLCTTKAKHE